MPRGPGKNYPCPECGGNSRVMSEPERWEEEGVLVRRHECKSCGYEFRTFQALLTGELMRFMRAKNTLTC